MLINVEPGKHHVLLSSASTIFCPALIPWQVLDRGICQHLHAPGWSMISPWEKMWTWGGIMYFRRFTHGSSIRGMWRCRMKKIVFLCNRWKLRHLLISDILSNSRTNLSTSESALPWIARSRETWWPTATFHLNMYNCTWKAISV